MQRSDRTIDMPQILSILNAIAGQLDFRSVIRAVSNEIKVLLPHDHLDVALVSVDGAMVTAYETGLHTEWDAATTAKTPVAISPIRDLLTGKVDHIITDDAQNDPRFHFEGAFSHAIFAAGLRGRLHAPLKVEGRVIGGLSFSTQEIGTYRPSDVRQARIVADILAPYFFALQQSELVRERELAQVEAEARAEGLQDRSAAPDRGARECAPGDRHGPPRPDTGGPVADRAVDCGGSGRMPESARRASSSRCWRTSSTACASCE